MVKNLPQTCLHSQSYLKLITDRLRKTGKEDRGRNIGREKDRFTEGGITWELRWRQRGEEWGGQAYMKVYN